MESVQKDTSFTLTKRSIQTISLLYRGHYIGEGNRSTRRKPPTCRKSL